MSVVQIISCQVRFIVLFAFLLIINRLFASLKLLFLVKKGPVFPRCVQYSVIIKGTCFIFINKVFLNHILSTAAVVCISKKFNKLMII